MKTFGIFFISVMLGISAIGQDYYYSNNRKIYLEKAVHWLTVQVSEDSVDIFRSKTLNSLNIKEIGRLLPERHFFWVEKRDGSEIETNKFAAETNIVRTFPAYFIIDGVSDTLHYILYDVFHVRFADDVSTEEVIKINQQYFVEIISKGYDNEYLLRLTERSLLSTLEISNIIRKRANHMVTS